MKKEYRIGEVAALLGVSIEGIRNYEKYGIIAPSRTEKAYRKYQYLDVTSLVRARLYRAFGFSLSEISDLTNRMQVPEIRENLRQKDRLLEREYQELFYKRKCLQDYIRDLDGLEARLGRAVMRQMPGFYRMEFARNGEIDLSDETVRRFRQWMSYTPFVHVSSRYHGRDVYGGLAVAEEYAALLGIRADETVQFQPGGVGISIVVMEHDNGYSNAECSQLIHAYAQKHSFALEGDPIGHTLIGVQKDTAYRRYREISVKILTESA